MAALRDHQKETRRVDCWSELPYHLLNHIMDSLSSTSIFDYISFGTVCASWRSAYKLHNPPRPPLPLLMVPPCFSTLFNPSGRDDDEGDDCILTNNNKKKKHKKKNKNDLKLRRFYNISDEKVDDRLKVRIRQNIHCRGSSYGWLITVAGSKSFSKREYSKRNKSSFTIQLFNPFLLSSSSVGGESNEIAHDYPKIVLPPFERSVFLNYADLYKAVLSADPISNPTDYMVMAIYSTNQDLAFHKPGDKSWTLIESPSIQDYRDGSFVDLIYYQGKFFAIHCMGTVVVCDDLAGGGVAARVLLRPPKTQYTGISKYLVESSQGNLLQVHRHLTVDTDNKTYSTIGFKVFKLLLLNDQKKVHEISADEEYKWVRVKSLRGDAMFLGHNASFSISTIDNPRCKSNCIYYTDNSDFSVTDARYGSHDMGVFNLVEGTFNRYFPTDPKDTSSISILPNPIWIQPSLPRKKVGSI